MLLWTQRVVLLGLVSTVGVLLLLCRIRPTWQIQQFQQQQGPFGSTGSSNGGSGNVGGEQQPAQMAIPFFRSGNDDDALSRWGHLNHKVEEYKQDLVKAVQGLDMIINTLESAAAPNANVRAGDMPGEGMRR
ncbi:unnamed protein product, partial [Ectocarpus sp. 8 AP-2014]